MPMPVYPTPRHVLNVYMTMYSRNKCKDVQNNVTGNSRHCTSNNRVDCDNIHTVESLLHSSVLYFFIHYYANINSWVLFVF